MTVATEIEKLIDNLSNSYKEAEKLSAEMPTHQNFDNLAATIATIKGGSAGKTYGVKLAYEYMQGLRDNSINMAAQIITDNKETDGSLPDSWEYKPTSIAEYFENVLVNSNECAYNILTEVKGR